MALLHCTCFRTSENIHIVSFQENDKVLKRRIQYHLPLIKKLSIVVIDDVAVEN